MSSCNSVILRHAGCDFTAMQTAHAMQSLEFVEVVSVTYRPGVVLPWHIFAKYPSDQVLAEEIDDAISYVMNEINEEDHE